MPEVLIRVRQEMEDRLEQIEADLKEVEPLIAERAELQRLLQTPPFSSVVPQPE
jgi:hypothetical protein